MPQRADSDNYGLRAKSPGLRSFMIGDRYVDLMTHSVTASGAEIHLTRIECRLLEHLIAHCNQTIPRQKLATLIWGRDPRRGPHSLRSVIKNVRRKLEPDPARPQYIVLDRTVGYRLQIN
jgi:two-component system, OmpR family, KDP operon response regulator KdpE